MPKDNTLQRLIEAQEASYQAALSEIKNSRKQSHWMWYIFPQIQGLGFSETSKFYAIKDLHEAEDYLKHPLLGSRLIEISNVLLKLPGNDAHSIFGSPDDMKLQSSMTLFSSLQNVNPVFQSVLDKFYNGIKDDRSVRMMKK